MRPRWKRNGGEIKPRGYDLEVQIGGKARRDKAKSSGVSPRGSHCGGKARPSRSEDEAKLEPRWPQDGPREAKVCEEEGWQQMQ